MAAAWVRRKRDRESWSVSANIQTWAKFVSLKLNYGLSSPSTLTSFSLLVVHSHCQFEHLHAGHLAHQTSQKNSGKNTLHVYIVPLISLVISRSSTWNKLFHFKRQIWTRSVALMWFEPERWWNVKMQTGEANIAKRTKMFIAVYISCGFNHHWKKKKKKRSKDSWVNFSSVFSGWSHISEITSLLVLSLLMCNSLWPMCDGKYLNGSWNCIWTNYTHMKPICLSNATRTTFTSSPFHSSFQKNGQV